MFRVNSLILLSSILCSCASELHTQTNNEPKSTKPIDRHQISELQRRKEIAKNYMNSLAKGKESWVDPYEMIYYPLEERHKYSTKTTQGNDFVEYVHNLKKDEEPLFSDIEGDVIGSKTSTANGMEEKSGLVPGGHFSKDRHISVMDSIYISRWIKKLVLKVEKESYSEPSSVIFPLDSSMLEKLNELSTAKSLEITELDELVCSMLAQATISRTKEFDWTVLFNCMKPIGWAMIILFVAYVLYMCIKYHPILTIISIFCFIVVFWHWMHLYQQRVASKHAELHSMQVPVECRKHEFGFLEHVQEYFVSYFKTNNCVKYYEALLVDAKWEVSISVAISEAVTATLLQPLSVISRVLNTALKQLFQDLSWDIKIIIIPAMFLILLKMCNYRIRLPFFMGAIEPYYSKGSCVQNLQSNRTLTSWSKEKICNLIQCNQEKDSKSLEVKHDICIAESLPGIFQNKLSMHTACTLRPIGVKLRPRKCSEDCGHSSLEVCQYCVSFKDTEVKSSSNEVGCGIERVSEFAMHGDHCCSCCLKIDNMQYLHEDCRVCSNEDIRQGSNAKVVTDNTVESGCTDCSVDNN